MKTPATARIPSRGYCLSHLENFTHSIDFFPPLTRESLRVVTDYLIMKTLHIPSLFSPPLSEVYHKNKTLSKLGACCANVS